MKNVNLLFIALCMLLAASCKKDFSQLPPGTVEPIKVSKEPTTPEEILLVENLEKVTAVLKELYKEKANLRLVNAAIFAKAYTDETILLKDLLYPEKSRLKENAAFKKYTQQWNVTISQFAQGFWSEANKKNDAVFLSFLRRLGGYDAVLRSGGSADVNMEEQVSIYFPYSEEFEPPADGGSYQPITSITTATADADEGWGSQPYYVNGIFQNYVQVLVNDDYAYNNPTQIIGVNGVEPYSAPSTANTIFPPTDPIHLSGLTREVKQVYVGEVRINKKHNYDHLISFNGNGGGSEIRFTRADGFLKVVDGQVQTADVYFTPAMEISRYNIKKGYFVDFSLEWDSDWELSNLQQNMAIYEEDNRNTSTFTGSLSTTVALALTPVTVSATRMLGFTINFKSDDDLIRQLNFNRDVFFVLNRTNLEGEMRNGWPVRDRQGDVSYTLGDRTYY